MDLDDLVEAEEGVFEDARGDGLVGCVVVAMPDARGADGLREEVGLCSDEGLLERWDGWCVAVHCWKDWRVTMAGGATCECRDGVGAWGG